MSGAPLRAVTPRIYAIAHRLVRILDKVHKCAKIRVCDSFREGAVAGLGLEIQLDCLLEQVGDARLVNAGRQLHPRMGEREIVR